MAKRGRPPMENPIEHKLSIRVPEAEYKRLSEYAKRHDVSVAYIIREALAKYFEDKQE